MYGDLLRALADDLRAGGPTADVLAGHQDDPGPSALALRLVGSVHRLVLAGAAPELTAYYPTTNGAWSPAGSAAVVSFLAQHGSAVRPLLAGAPQTNEVGRAAALMGGLLRLSARWRLPVRLFEIGASGGLNLQADRFRFTDQDGHGWGDPASPVLLERAWAGASVPTTAPLEIVERGGCDLYPVDVGTEDGRLRLTSYVWPDMTARHQRLAGAIAVARARPVVVQEADAASYVEQVTLAPDHLTVLWHSVMWQYVPAEQQTRATAALERLGLDATSRSPLVHLYAEPTRRTPDADHEFWVVAETWPGGGEPEFLGRMAPHGLPARWE